MATHGRTRNLVIDSLRSMTPFKTSGSLRGVEGKDGGGFGGDGRLPHNIAKEFAEADVAYTVYSYATPIAWVTRSGLTRIPNISYSTTTTAQQSLCRTYLNGGC